MTPAPILFTIHGDPIAQPRPRFVNGRAVSTASKPAKWWKLQAERIAAGALANMGHAAGAPYFTGPVLLEVRFVFQPPANRAERIGTRHTHKPDADNLLKGLMDAMTKARVWKDDAQVSDPAPVKMWGLAGATIVRVSAVEEDQRIRADGRESEGLPAWLSDRADVADIVGFSVNLPPSHDMGHAR